VFTARVRRSPGSCGLAQRIQRTEDCLREDQVSMMTTMKKSSKGLTTIEMIFAIVTIAVLTGIYLFMVDSYKYRRMGEQAAKVLMLAAKVQEDFFAREHHYFDAEISGNSVDGYLMTPDGQKTNVQIPPSVVLSMKSQGKDKTAFTGTAYYQGGKFVHYYDSTTGKITTSERRPDKP
jgi:Tfp pilus assembly protein PilE